MTIEGRPKQVFTIYLTDNTNIFVTYSIYQRYKSFNKFIIEWAIKSFDSYQFNF